jgi:2-hydroxymuconate-semialdehyde hydrolase
MTVSDRYLDFRGIPVHCIEGGAGAVIMMLHGVGPGTSVEGNFLPILGSLTEHYRIVGVDLIGFGKSARKPAPPYFDFPLWLEQMQYVLDRIEDAEVGILAHSCGAALALKLAARNRRVTRVLTTGSAGRSFPVNRYLDLLWTFPESKEQLREAMSCALWDKSGLTDAFLEDRLMKLHQPGYKEYFSQLFRREERQAMVDSWTVNDDELGTIDANVVMVHGREDLPIPFESTTARLAPLIRRADVCLLAQCGHSVAVEYPAKVMALARTLFG